MTSLYLTHNFQYSLLSMSAFKAEFVYKWSGKGLTQKASPKTLKNATKTLEIIESIRQHLEKL